MIADIYDRLTNRECRAMRPKYFPEIDLVRGVAVMMMVINHAGLALMSDVVRRPTFLQAEIERQKQQALSSLRVAAEDPESVAGLVIDRLIFGFHPYGLPGSGTPESLQALTRADFVDVDGSEIEQDFRLRLLPVAFTFRVLPLRQTSPVQPYFGAGLALVSWRYSEHGDFVDFQRQNAIFPGRFVASGTEPGAVVLGGIRFAGDGLSGGFEVRYLTADAGLERPFSILQTNPRIDLGGWTTSFTVNLRF